jgi:transcription initiation factor TFIIF subunit beta
MARMPRNQLLDQIFTLFRDPARWGIKALREKTQQPEAYLKEVLSEVAFLHRSGEYNGLWELKDNFKGDAGRIIESQSMSDVKMESVDEAEDEDEDEEDEDMEEVS